jgi:hypothetical protein
MVYIFDYIPELGNFEWSLSLHKLGHKYTIERNEKIVSRFSGYQVYFKYVIVIWSRIIDDLKLFQSLKNKRDEQIFPRGRTGKHTLTADEKGLMVATDNAKVVLEVDYESFLIFVNILLDKIAKISSSLLSEDKKDTIPSRSFHDHKKYFLIHYDEFMTNNSNILRSIKNAQN